MAPSLQLCPVDVAVGGQVTPALGAELRASLLSAAFKNK